MARQQIEFVIRPDGSVEERVSGVAGPECVELTRGIEDALGQVTRREPTGEFFNESETTGDTVTTGRSE